MSALAACGLARHSSSARSIRGATIVASDSMTNIGVSSVSLSHVIFSLGVAPEYDPYDVVESEIWQKYAHGFTGCSRSYLIDGTTQIGKSPAMPPPIWKKPTPAPVDSSLYWS